MKKTPEIAVLMAAYNAEKTIHKALNSLKANNEPHDIIIVDDGSHIPLKEFLKPQPNMTIIRPEQNLGVTGAFNYGLNFILKYDYSYVAVLDADDVASPDRLSVQRAYLEQHKNVNLVGGWGKIVSEDGKILFFLKHPTEPDSIKKALNYNNAFIHSTIMYRASALRQYGTYSSQYAEAAQDYELIRRLSTHGPVANLPVYLVEYTVSTTGVSVKKRHKQVLNRLRIQWEYRNFLNIHFYFGIIKTLFLYYIPIDLITSIKRRLPAYQK